MENQNKFARKEYLAIITLDIRILCLQLQATFSSHVDKKMLIKILHFTGVQLTVLSTLDQLQSGTVGIYHGSKTNAIVSRI